MTIILEMPREPEGDRKTAAPILHPDDRGECRELVPVGGGLFDSHLAPCTGRRISSMTYVREVGYTGYAIVWTCNKCGHRRVV